MATPSTSNKPRNQRTDPAELDERIRRRAYDLYEQHRKNGSTEGHDVDDWLQAEAELNGKKIRATAT